MHKVIARDRAAVWLPGLDECPPGWLSWLGWSLAGWGLAGWAHCQAVPPLYAHMEIMVSDFSYRIIGVWENS